MKDQFIEDDKRFGLIEICDDECPMCGRSITFYQSEYIDGVEIRFCSNCEEYENGNYIQRPQDNICPYCDEIIKPDQEDDFVTCSIDGCESKSHVNCAGVLICADCNIWACEKHENEVYFCDRCETFHEYDCIVSHVPEFVESIGVICKNCFDRDEDIIEEIKKPYKEESDRKISEIIEKKRHYYLKEAKQNFDLTILLSHMLKTNRDRKPYELLLKVLDEKRLVSSETGYYRHTDGTKAVCFADLTTRGLVRHSKKYSQFGLAFLKEYLFDQGCGPALYIREDLIASIVKIDDKLKPYINKIDIESYDFHHEREWRLPHDLEFEYTDIFALYAPMKFHAELRERYPDIQNILDIDFLQMI